MLVQEGINMNRMTSLDYDNLKPIRAERITIGVERGNPQMQPQNIK